VETQITLNRGGFPPFSARGCTQTLTPLVNGELRRTVNGELLFTGSAGHQKYRTRLQCLDASSPALDGIARGEPVEVGCIARLVQEVVGDATITNVLLSRTAVPGSARATTLKGEEVAIESVDARQVNFQQPIRFGEKIYLSYQPVLTMRVLSFHLEINEWGALVGWRLDLEEI
jgi:hypothetical protein